jgi:hypothetical protein
MVEAEGIGIPPNGTPISGRVDSGPEWFKEIQIPQFIEGFTVAHRERGKSPFRFLLEMW